MTSVLTEWVRMRLQKLTDEEVRVLADKVDVSFGTLKNIKKGRFETKATTLEALVKKLGGQVAVLDFDYKGMKVPELLIKGWVAKTIMYHSGIPLEEQLKEMREIYDGKGSPTRPVESSEDCAST